VIVNLSHYHSDKDLHAIEKRFQKAFYRLAVSAGIDKKTALNKSMEIAFKYMVNSND